MRPPLAPLALTLSLFAAASGCNCGSKAGTSSTSTPSNGTGNGTGASTGIVLGTGSGSSGSATNGGTGGATTSSPYGSQMTASGPASLSDGGGFGSGVQNVPDGGGVTLGAAANFSSAFAYLANSGQAPGSSFVSRVNTRTGVEEARYPSVLPLDNGGQPLCTAGSVASCLVDVGPSYFDNAPSRTVVDLNGGVFVANRGQCDWDVCTGDAANASYVPVNPDPAIFSPYVDGGVQQMHGAVQGSVTYIANRVDHPEQCAPRCQKRAGWNLPDGGAAIFSSGGSLPLADGGVVTLPPTELLMPSPGAGDAGTLLGFAPDLVAHPCLDNGPGAHDPTDVTDPTNYDDCARFTIPVGAPNGYDLKIQSRYNDRFAPRGLAISKNCGVLNDAPACDVYVGLTEPSSESSEFVHLGFQNNFQPVNTIDTNAGNYFAYGAAIGCDGMLWTGHGNDIAGIDTTPGPNQDQLATWSYNDGDGGVFEESLFTDPTGFCNAYGTAVDLQQHFWFGSAGPAGVCAFDYGTLLNTASLHDGSLDYDAGLAIVDGLYRRFPLTLAAPGNGFAGIVVDKKGTAYSVCNGNPCAVAVTYDGGGTGCGASNDAGVTDSPCLWFQSSGFKTPLGYSHGVDLDQDGNPVVSLLGNSGLEAEETGEPAPSTLPVSGVVALSSFDGGPLALYQNPDLSYGLEIQGTDGGNDVLYTYSDFTGYALRNITQPSGLFEEIFQACPPQSTIVWNQLIYSATLPSGTSISFQIDSADDPAAFTNQSGTGPQILGTWSCAATTVCPSPAALTGLGSTSYVRVAANLKGLDCAQAGAGPVLNALQLAYTCIPNISQ